MKKTLTTSEVADELFNGGENGFSYAGARALAEHLEDLERDMGEEVELDVAAIRCDFSEHKSLADWAHDYFGGEFQAADGLGCESDTPADEADEKTRDFIRDHGALIEFNGGIIVSSF